MKIRSRILLPLAPALLGADFAESCGAELIADQIVIPVNGNPILFAYGDQWCVRDQVRQARRAVLRDPIWQESLLAQPAHERAAVIDEALRKCATENEAPKNPRDFDVIESAVAESARAAGVELVIHGHTHHPGAHVNAVIERWVLPDWEFDLTETSCRSGYITFMQGGRPQIQMM